MSVVVIALNRHPVVAPRAVLGQLEPEPAGMVGDRRLRDIEHAGDICSLPIALEELGDRRTSGASPDRLVDLDWRVKLLPAIDRTSPNAVRVIADRLGREPEPSGNLARAKALVQKPLHCFTSCGHEHMFPRAADGKPPILAGRLRPPFISVGTGVTAARDTLDVEVGVQIPGPQSYCRPMY